MNPIDIALEVGRSQLGKPYLWGGDDPMAGFDCSGLMIECLKSAGVLPRDGDWTADGLLKEHGWPRVRVHVRSLRRGCLVFWGSEARATHVEIVYAVVHEGGLVYTLGASGGGSRTLTIEDAIRQNAYVKIRPLRSAAIAAVDPFRAYRPSWAQPEPLEP